jgi:putative protease
MERQVGRVTHYYSKAGVAVVELEDTLRKGDTIHIKGHTSDWVQKVESIQIEHQDIEEASRGQVVGIKVRDHAREHDVVYLVEE